MLYKEAAATDSASKASKASISFFALVYDIIVSYLTGTFHAGACLNYVIFKHCIDDKRKTRYNLCDNWLSKGGRALNSVEYKFHTICHESEKSYIFQFVKGRKLTGIYHSHDFYELICFLRGEGRQILNDKEVLAKEKTVVLLCPGDKHCFVDQSDDIEIISLSVSCEEFEALAGIYGISCRPSLLSFDFPRISRLYDIYRESRAAGEADCKLILSTLLHAYLHTKEGARPANIPKALRLAVEEMKKAENLRLGIAAFISLSNYSHSHLARLVKKHFGMGLKQYVNELRLLYAYDEIIWTNEPIEVISENAGFSSYSHFYKIFQKRFSVSPSSLRKGGKNRQD